MDVFPLRRGFALLLGLVAGPAMTLLAAVELAFGLFSDGPVLARLLALVAAPVGVLFFGACSVLALALALGPERALVVGPRGLRDTTSPAAVGDVAWDEIREWRIADLHGQPVLYVVLHDPEAVLRRVGPVRRLVGRVNLRISGTPVCVALRWVCRDRGPVREALHRHRPRR